uniref:Uncharacterized protein n=1 Tax=Fundulus heteroclitus TaxID=8078 RepID=A0A3Q2TCP6_FUNHE
MSLQVFSNSDEAPINKKLPKELLLSLWGIPQCCAPLLLHLHSKEATSPPISTITLSLVGKSSKRSPAATHDPLSHVSY